MAGCPMALQIAVMSCSSFGMYLSPPICVDGKMKSMPSRTMSASFFMRPESPSAS